MVTQLESSAKINLNSVYMYNQGYTRKQAIECIRDLRYGNSFIHNKQAYYEEEKSIALTDEELKKLFVSMNYMTRVIKEVVTLAPLLKQLKLPNRKKVDRRNNKMKKALEENEWDLLFYEIIDTLEECGDAFLEIYFIKNNPIPQLRLLDSGKLINIIQDDYGNIKAYVYEDEIVSEELNEWGDLDLTNSRTVKWIFERGKTTIIDPSNYAYDEEGLVIKDEKGKKVIQPIVKKNKTVFANEFLLLHIPSFKRQGQVFSDIPSSGYVDYCIWADAISTDFRYTNRLAGFPISIIMDGQLAPNSSRSPGGFIFINSKDTMGGNKADFKSIEIKNKLETYEREWDRVENALFETASLMRPENKSKASGSDSSRVYAQGQIPLELKLRRYLTSVNKTMTKFFEIAQLSDGYKEGFKYSFIMPDPIIENSKFDKNLLNMQALSIGTKTIEDLLREDGLNDKEIAEKIKQINAEFYEKNKDISISKEAKNQVASANPSGTSLDNNFK